MLKVIEAFMAAHQLPDVTAAHAGTVSEANQKQVEAAYRSSSERDPVRADLHTEFRHLGARRRSGRPDQPDPVTPLKTVRGPVADPGPGRQQDEPHRKVSGTTLMPEYDGKITNIIAQ